MSSFKSSENIQKKEGGPDKFVRILINTLKARKLYCNFKLQQRSHTMTDINPNQRTNGPVNAHLISWPSKAQNIQNLENIW